MAAALKRRREQVVFPTGQKKGLRNGPRMEGRNEKGLTCIYRIYVGSGIFSLKLAFKKECRERREYTRMSRGPLSFFPLIFLCKKRGERKRHLRRREGRVKSTFPSPLPASWMLHTKSWILCHVKTVAFPSSLSSSFSENFFTPFPLSPSLLQW